MDIVTDLTAEAVAYITLFQDILKGKASEDLSAKLISKKSWMNLIVEDIQVKSLTPNQKENIQDLIWHSPSKADADELALRYFTITLELLQWLSTKVVVKEQIEKTSFSWVPFIGQQEKKEELILFRPPFFWRQQIRTVLFSIPDERITLVEILRYMPLLVIRPLADKEKSAYRIRLYQLYEKSEGSSTNKFYNLSAYDILNVSDRKIHTEWWQGKNEIAENYLTNDHALLIELKKKELPLPFETLFRDELIEIVKAREARQLEWNITSTKKENNNPEPQIEVADENPVFDPFVQAKDMGLMGIAFSGGGIRSATFNLGIIQRLANLNVLHQFDYMSTVSGGGYIGTWLNSWIKRSGSFSKVTDRLCPDRSGDPLADEVRPIRWLRMFSNYLSPNVGIMSPDAWASGMTWLRNTLINQAVLLLILLTTLSFISDIFQGWNYVKDHVIILSPIQLLYWSIGMLIPGSLLASVAMRSFYKIDKKSPQNRRLQILENLKLSLSSFTKITAFIPHLLVVWASICAILISTYFSGMPHPPGDEVSRKWVLIYVAASALGAFLWVASWGNYHKREDLIQIGKDNIAAVSAIARRKMSAKMLIAIISSSVAAACTLAILLWIFWAFIADIYCELKEHTYLHPDKMMLVIGVPIILEIFSIAVIVRMALMGNLFPDYRREWWGRMGGYIHRFILLWVVVTFACLIMPSLWPTSDRILPAAWGGWAGVIGWGVKKAFESKDDTSNKKNSITSLLIKIVPFIFMIGVLLIGSWINSKIRVSENPAEFDWTNPRMTAILALITLIVSYRVGVNEFSLHHFYRNRLIRAFMGATRTREDRIKTANAFTGFDTNDDVLLSSMRVANGYSGPFPLINAALNATVVSALDRQDRMAESFIFSPLYCGFDFSPTRSSTYNVDHVYEYGYRPTDQFSNKNGGPTMGTAMAISGAAIAPNWGYHSSPAMAFLLTLFNVRLGWWIGNPRLNKWKNPDPKFGLIYLLRDLLGKSDINMNYVCLSDGGHFDNMGLYELVRRRCSYIVLGDGEQDQDATCEGLANAIRRCRIDFGVEITIIITNLTQKQKDKDSIHVVKGDIIYPGSNQEKGTLIYIKTTLSGDEPVDIREYAMANPDFPQESTGDQFFDEAQFESYRKLGYHSIKDIGELHMPIASKR